MDSFLLLGDLDDYTRLRRNFEFASVENISFQIDIIYR